MASTILYKFRSGTNFEPLPFPGTSARLFDIKRAIVRAKKLDRSATGSGLEFDLAVQNASTNEVYEDETMVLPRGTRIIVRRVAAERNQGLLSRMARAQASGDLSHSTDKDNTIGNAVSNGFYTIRSRDREDEDEFLDQEPNSQVMPEVSVVDEKKELEALKAVTDQAGSMYGNGMPRNSNAQTNKVWNAGGNSLGSANGGTSNPRGGGLHFSKPSLRSRPNADPELREQEARQQPQPKKRATGIPRTFLSLTPSHSSAAAEGEKDNEHNGDQSHFEGGGLATRLQPNTIGFEALVNRAGGQSQSNSAGKRRDLDYALKLTATTIPEHLQCGICHSVVKNAMLIPWDPEGRPTCESCIRDALAQSGFKCPLTGMDGVSPDDLFPNVGLRKAADLFVQGIMDKMDQIEKQIEAEEAEEEKRNRALMSNSGAKKGEEYEGVSGDKGILVTREATRETGRKRRGEDLFDGDDEFGGDVFDVVNDDDAKPNAAAESEHTELLISDAPKPIGEKIDTSSALDNNSKTEPNEQAVSRLQGQNESTYKENKTESNITLMNDTAGQNVNSVPSIDIDNPSCAPSDTDATRKADKSCEGSANKNASRSPSDETVTAPPSSRPPHQRREAPKRRGPPVGYVLGPAGGGGLAANASPAKFPTLPNGVVGTPMPTAHIKDGAFCSIPPPPPPPVGGRGTNAPLAAPHFGRGRSGSRFPQNQFGSRSPFHTGRMNRNMNNDQQLHQYSNKQHRHLDPTQQHGGYRDSGRGRQPFPHQGRGFTGRISEHDQHWGDNMSNDWNRKRPRDTHEGNGMQEIKPHCWGGSGERDFAYTGHNAPYPSSRGRYDGRGRPQGRGFSGSGRGRGGGHFRGRGFGRGRF